jgi:hypothetical protein
MFRGGPVYLESMRSMLVDQGFGDSVRAGAIAEASVMMIQVVCLIEWMWVGPSTGYWIRLQYSDMTFVVSDPKHTYILHGTPLWQRLTVV